MSRQRTVCDHAFWHSPKLQSCSTEEKLALLYLLTAPVSNITGVYELIPKLAAAEIGWDEDEWLRVIDRLQSIGLLRFEPHSVNLWVRIWWDHHSANQVLGPKLRARTLNEISRIPKEWRNVFIEDLRCRISPEQQEYLPLPANSECQEDAVVAAQGYGIPTLSDGATRNCNSNNQTKLEKPTPQVAQPGRSSNQNEVPGEVETALSRARNEGVSLSQISAAREKVAGYYRSGRSPKNPGGLAYFLAKSLPEAGDLKTSLAFTREELDQLIGQCFRWSEPHKEAFIRISEDGTCERYAVENGELIRRVEFLCNGAFTDAFREGKLQKIPRAEFEQFLAGD